eukprot:TRINITY_DN1443_c0_g2_i1.p3 TRINITY_DN1443_c0_g2~~TRINITY_DN1443_c0_g2_i1.p3  ORF type:complete len:131 (+),score=33.37 TRINITY_DN1443_c0_g2_i1:311-703(+)
MKLNKPREAPNLKLRKSVENYGKVGNSGVLRGDRKSLVKSSLGFIKDPRAKRVCTKLNSKLEGQKTKSMCKLGYKKGTKSNDKKHMRVISRESLLLSKDITKEYSMHVMGRQQRLLDLFIDAKEDLFDSK